MAASYYDKELQVLVDTKETTRLRVQICGGAERTKWLNVNLDNIESLKAFFDIFADDLEKAGG